LTPFRIWERSRGLAVGGVLVVLAMVAVVIGTALNPHGTFAVFAPNFFWGLAGIFVGLWIAIDVLTRDRESGKRSQR
jgi:hypothetical protein